jgi:glycosyltransferase involved in cell wall biosynthesis
MSVISRLRTTARRMPLGRSAAGAVRRLTAAGFSASAFARHGWRRRPGAVQAGPVVVVGFHGSVLGLGDGVRAFSSALRAAGTDVTDWDIAEVFGHDQHLAGDCAAAPPPGAGPMVIHLNPRELIQLVALYGQAPFAGRRVIGYWAWELEAVPRDWAGAFRYVDEVWTPSNFVAEAVRAAAPESVPVRVFPHLVSLLPTGLPDPSLFNLPQDRFVVLTSFDMRSGFVRKNPFAAIAAVSRAAELSKRPATLVCKVVGREGSPALFAQLQAEAAQMKTAAFDVRFITDWLSGEAMASLIASADAVISLHRSEGFGLLPAQAMLAAKPVVATDWSGNLDFMDRETSRLVDYDLVPVEDSQGLYAGGHWAEPDIDDAARQLARLIAFPSEARALGAAAAASIRDKLDPVRWGQIARLWLGQAEGGG